MRRVRVSPRIQTVLSRLVMLAMLSLAAGCGQGIDDRADLDDLINRVWLVDFETRDAIEHLETGGTHYDYLESDGTTVDADLVLPFLIRLRDEFQVETLAVLETEQNWAWVLLVRLPGNPRARRQIEAAVLETDAGFDGDVSMEWGYQWLAIDFLED
jgi:hypothetical protein